MNALDTLSTYGLSAFGVREKEASDALARYVSQHPDGPQRASSYLTSTLSSLLQKMEAVDDGRSCGFRIDAEEGAVLDALIAAGTVFSVRRDGATVRAA